MVAPRAKGNDVDVSLPERPQRRLNLLRPLPDAQHEARLGHEPPPAGGGGCLRRAEDPN